MCARPGDMEKRIGRGRRDRRTDTLSSAPTAPLTGFFWRVPRDEEMAGERGTCTSTQQRGNQEAEQRSTWPPPPGGRMQDRTMRGTGRQGTWTGHLCLPGSPPWGLRQGSQVWGQRHHNSSSSVSAGTFTLSFSGYLLSYRVAGGGPGAEERVLSGERGADKNRTNIKCKVPFLLPPLNCSQAPSGRSSQTLRWITLKTKGSGLV